jgi:hypothetical protein
MVTTQIGCVSSIVSFSVLFTFSFNLLPYFLWRRFDRLRFRLFRYLCFEIFFLRHFLTLPIVYSFQMKSEMVLSTIPRIPFLALVRSMPL